jgi:hypothetical protein
MAERESKKMKKDTAVMETEQKLLELQSFLSEAMSSLHNIEGASYKTLVDPLVAIEVSVLRKRIQSLEELLVNSKNGDIPVKGMNYAILEDKMDNMTKQHDSIIQGISISHFLILIVLIRSFIFVDRILA